jgi:hypothetical protein
MDVPLILRARVEGDVGRKTRVICEVCAGAALTAIWAVKPMNELLVILQCRRHPFLPALHMSAMAHDTSASKGSLYQRSKETPA